jgi:uncharacterized protein
MLPSVEILIIGAGPAGLAAASCCTVRNKDFIIAETGPRIEMRNHSDTNQLAHGVGGSGLYSDGKFSFFPSATSLWRLPDRKALNEGYDWVCNHLSGFGMATPKFPLECQDNVISKQGKKTGEITSKKYPSFYLSLKRREQLTQKLEQVCGASLVADFTVTEIQYDQSSRKFNCRLTSNKTKKSEMVSCRTIVFAGGRFGPVGLFSIFPATPKIFLRLELGVRIQQPTADFFLNSDCQVDPKLILKGNDDFEYRTFCCCRNGEVVTIPTGNIKTVSGRGDCEESGFSNVGLNLRVEKESIGAVMWETILKSLRLNSHRFPIEEPWESFIDMQNKSTARPSSAITQFFGTEISNRLAHGLTQFQQSLSINYQSAILVAPTVEAVAFYPKINDNLNVVPYPLWVAGDSTGVFRGLTAALVSGYYAANQAVRYLDGNKG